MIKYIYNKKYTFDDGYICLPLDIRNLPEQITIEEYSLQLKTEFHCSLVCVKCINSKYEKNFNNLESKIIECFCKFVSKNEISFIRYKNEFRLVKREERMSVVVMCDVFNLGDFFNLLEKRFGIKADTQPTHVTLYTLQPDRGIGISDQATLQLTTLVNVPDEVRKSLNLI